MRPGPRPRSKPSSREFRYELEPTTAVGNIEVHDFNRTILEGPNLPENLIIKGVGQRRHDRCGRRGRPHHARNSAVARRAADARRLAVRSIGQPQAAARIDRQAVRPRVQGAGHHRGRRQRGFQAARREAAADVGRRVRQRRQSADAQADRRSHGDQGGRPRSIDDDPQGDGRENVFQSVGFLAEKFRHYRLAAPRRNVMIVVFTDEAGDDVEALDAAVDVCRKYEMPVYVIGVPAPFGRETALREIRRPRSEVRSIAAIGARASGAGVAAARADHAAVRRQGRGRRTNRFRLRPVRALPAGLRNGRPVFHRAPESRNGQADSSRGKRRRCRRTSPCSSTSA